MTANENEEVGNTVAETMRLKFYADDCLRSVATNAQAINQINGLCQACGKGGFRLTTGKFVCHQRDVLGSIPEEERSKDVKTLDLNYDDVPIERALVCTGVSNPTPSDFVLSSRTNH